MRSYWEEDLAILSAENVSFSVETAGLGSRLAAATIDLTIQLLLLLLGSLAVTGFSSYVYPIENMPQWAKGTLLGLGIVLGFLLFNGYYFFFEWLWDGQTPGKRRLGLRTMMADGMPLTMWSALSRNVVRSADFLPFCYGLGAAVVLLNPLNQRMGDLAAGTIVARERRREKHHKPLTINEAVDKFLAAATTVPGTGPQAAGIEDAELHMALQSHIDPEAAALALQLDREDYELARDFLLRREALPQLARERLARSLTLRFAARLGQMPPMDHETWLQETVATLSRAYGH